MAGIVSLGNWQWRCDEGVCMKKLGFSVKAIGLFWIFMLLGACDSDGAGGLLDPTDTLYGLDTVVSDLNDRVKEGLDPELMVNYQDACDAIYKWCGSSFTPPPGTELHTMNMKSLLTMMDKVNQDRTNYSGSVYATAELGELVVDKEALDVIVERLWQPSRLFVVLSGGNVISYSVDAKVWHLAGSSSSLPEYRDIAYGSGKFVVVENNRGKSSSIYSFDGHNWFVGSDSDVRMGAVAYGNGKFVGVNDDYNGYVSGDGVSWQSVSISTNGGNANFSDLIDIAYGADKFVAIQSGGDKYVVTTDGADWEWKEFLPATGDWHSIIYEDDKFIAVGKGGKIAVLTDGVKWDKVVTGDSLDLVGLAYGAGKFVALSGSGRVITSTNGIDWTESVVLKNEAEAVRGWDSIAYGDNKFVAVAGHYLEEGEEGEAGKTVQSGRIAISTDGGVSWQISNPLENRDGSRIIYVEDIKGNWKF
jgi:hypothetical protein